MSAIVERAGLDGESLGKPGAKPRYAAVLKMLSSLGVKLTASAS